MKMIALLTAVAMTFFSVAAHAQYEGPYYGKGKAPPPPVVTKGWASNWRGPAIVPVPHPLELHVSRPGYSAMQRADMEVIFPIKDAASARLMAVKAGCLRKAGMISEREKQWVDSRVGAFLNDAIRPASEHFDNLRLP
jgi:hypothetical protein